MTLHNIDSFQNTLEELPIDAYTDYMNVEIDLLRDSTYSEYDDSVVILYYDEVIKTEEQHYKSMLLAL